MDSIHWSVSPWGINVDLPPNLPSSLTDPDSPASRPSIIIGICVSLITIVFLCRAYFRAVVERVWEFGDCTSNPTWLCLPLSTTKTDANRAGSSGMGTVTPPSVHLTCNWLTASDRNSRLPRDNRGQYIRPKSFNRLC